MNARRLACLLPLLTAMLAALPAHAGQTCHETPLEPATVRSAFRSGLALQQQLDQLSPDVAVIARVGQDLSEYGLRYSHAAFVTRDAPGQPWRVSHLLNDCGQATSVLWREGLANFFLDDMFSYESLVVIPDAQTQARLRLLLRNPASLEQMHASRYNMLAYPYSTQYQNSNQWVLEVLSEALAGRQFARRADAQAWLQSAGYQPGTLQIGAMKRLGGRMFRANVAFDDHPTQRRMAGQIDTITVESVIEMLKRNSPETQLRPVPAPAA